MIFYGGCPVRLGLRRHIQDRQFANASDWAAERSYLPERMCERSVMLRGGEADTSRACNPVAVRQVYGLEASSRREDRCSSGAASATCKVMSCTCAGNQPHRLAAFLNPSCVTTSLMSACHTTRANRLAQHHRPDKFCNFAASSHV